MRKRNLVFPVFSLLVAFLSTGCDDQSPLSNEGVLDSNDENGIVQTNETGLEREGYLGIVGLLGFDTNMVAVSDSFVVVEGDISFTTEQLMEYASGPLAKRTQAKTSYLVGAAYQGGIRVQIHSSASAWSSLINSAVKAWNDCHSNLKMYVVSSSPHITIYSDESSSCPSSHRYLGYNTCAMASFPSSSGLPGATVSLNMNSTHMNTDAKRLYVITHELGHCIGYRHTNWSSLGESTAETIYSTPNGENASLMNGGECGEVKTLSGYDRQSLHWLYSISKHEYSNFGKNAGGWTSQNYYPRMTGDVNGDGKGDVVGFGNSAVQVSLSTGTGFGNSANWCSSYFCRSVGGWTTQNDYPRFLGDVNGDGKDDIVGFGDAGVYVAISNGSGFGNAQKWYSGYAKNAGGWSTQNDFPRFVADVNGDGRDDIIGCAGNGVVVSLSTGSSFGSARLWYSGYAKNAGGWSTQNDYPRFVGDVNGDGRADFIGCAGNGVVVSVSSGSAFGSAGLWISNFGKNAGGWQSQDSHPRAIGDVNGDGRVDMVGFGEYDVYVGLSTGSSLNFNYWMSWYTRRAGWNTHNDFPRTVAKVFSSKCQIIGFAGDGVKSARNNVF